jgi:hypothetical protein
MEPKRTAVNANFADASPQKTLAVTTHVPTAANIATPTRHRQPPLPTITPIAFTLNPTQYYNMVVCFGFVWLNVVRSITKEQD